MRRRILVPVALAAVAALSFSMVAQSAEGDKVTGGGQILNEVNDEPVGGAGDTIAFNARGVGPMDAAEGQVQYIDREVGGNGKGTGQNQLVAHGIVRCLIVDHTEQTAVIQGDWTKGRTGVFKIWVKDNGEGNGSEDMIEIETVATDPRCGENDPQGDNGVALARGNVQIHKAP